MVRRTEESQLKILRKRAGVGLVRSIQS